MEHIHDPVVSSFCQPGCVWGDLRACQGKVLVLAIGQGKVPDISSVKVPEAMGRFKRATAPMPSTPAPTAAPTDLATLVTMEPVPLQPMCTMGRMTFLFGHSPGTSDRGSLRDGVGLAGLDSTLDISRQTTDFMGSIWKLEVIRRFHQRNWGFHQQTRGFLKSQL